MAKQVIILRVSKGSGGDTDLRYLFWLVVPTGQEVPILNATSQWSGANAAENALIAAGSIIEEDHEQQVPSGTTKAQVETALASLFSARQTQITNQFNPNQFFGIFLDSITGWSA